MTEQEYFQRMAMQADLPAINIFNKDLIQCPICWRIIMRDTICKCFYPDENTQKIDQPIL